MTWQDLSPQAKVALVDAVSSMPDDSAHRAPLCERISHLLDVLVPLTQREDLTTNDRELLKMWLSEGYLITCTIIIGALDAHTGNSRPQ